MSDIDRAVAEYCANRADIAVSEFDRIEFGHYVSCYSSWTCDYDVTGTVVTKSGRRIEIGEGFPAVIEGLRAFREADRAMSDEHQDYHGG